MRLLILCDAEIVFLQPELSQTSGDCFVRKVKTVTASLCSSGKHPLDSSDNLVACAALLSTCLVFFHSAPCSKPRTNNLKHLLSRIVP